jgi:hypothetical protein
MTDQTAQAQAESAELLRRSELVARLAARHNAPLGVIDTAHTQAHHYRLTSIGGEHAPLLDSLRHRYDPDDQSAHAGVNVTFYAHARPAASMLATPTHVAASASPAAANIDSPSTAAADSSPVAGKFRVSRRPATINRKPGPHTTSALPTAARRPVAQPEARAAEPTAEAQAAATSRVAPRAPEAQPTPAPDANAAPTASALPVVTTAPLPVSSSPPRIARKRNDAAVRRTVEASTETDATANKPTGQSETGDAHGEASEAATSPATLPPANDASLPLARAPLRSTTAAARVQRAATTAAAPAVAAESAAGQPAAGIVWRTTNVAASSQAQRANVSAGATQPVVLARSPSRAGAQTIARVAANSGATSSASAHGGEETPAPAPARAQRLDVEQIAEHVSRIIFRRLRVEGERRGR